MKSLHRLQERAVFWGEEGNHLACGTTDAPYQKHRTIMISADVLEIGPGAGKQFTVLHDATASYAVADISPYILDLPLYRNAARYHLTSYEQDLGKCFDVITFWYVLHHVRLNETLCFFDFIKRHLRENGRAYFNMPDQNHPFAKDDDGFGTTPHTLDNVNKALTCSDLTLVDVEHTGYDSLNILAKRT